MAGGRRTKKTAKGKAKSKQMYSTAKEINAQEEKQTSTQSSTPKKGSEQVKQLPQLGKESESPAQLPSKYVPTFSRAGKNSCKTDEKSLTRSPNTRKRRNVALLLVDSKNEVEICKESKADENGGPSLRKSKFIDDNDNNQAFQNSTEEDNEEVEIHPNKQIKLSNIDKRDHISQPCDMTVNENSAKMHDKDKMITEQVVQSDNTNEKDLKDVAAPEKSIAKAKNDKCNSQSSKSSFEDTSKSNKVEKSETAPGLSTTSSEEQGDTSTAPSKENCSSNNNSTKDEQHSLLDDVKDSLYHLIEQIYIEIDVKDPETEEVPNHKQSTKEQKGEACFLSSNQHLVANVSKEVTVEPITDQSFQAKISTVNGKEEQDIQPGESKPVNEEEVSQDQDTDVKKQQPSNVSEIDDMEFLMDCTDSQLIGDEVLEQAFMDGNFRAKAATKIEVSDNTPTAQTSDHELEDGTVLVQEIMQEISSMKSYLTMMKNKYEQIHKRNGPWTMPQ